jgi:hypothetical protein
VERLVKFDKFIGALKARPDHSRRASSATNLLWRCVPDVPRLATFSLRLWRKKEII